MKLVKINHENASLLNDLNGKEFATMLFFHPQCGHCLSMKPQWEMMKKMLSKRKKPCNIYEVNGEHMDKIHHPMRNIVDGFPTILNVNNGKLQPFEKERNAKNMLQFVLSNLPKNNSGDKNNATRSLKKRKVSFHLNNNKNLVKKRVIANNNKIANILKLYGLNPRKVKTFKGGIKNKKTRRNRKKSKRTIKLDKK